MLKEADGTLLAIKRCEVTKGRKMLGVKMRHDGNEKENLKWFKTKTEQWADKIRIGWLEPEEAWMAMKLTIFKSVEYPFLATCFMND
jgi:1,2-phenylacetyl-CoA epoxidase catalytic subunit